MPDKHSNSGSAGGAASGCVDQDGDGFGDSCSAGRDCNDFNPTVTDQCFGACSDPAKGCDCNGDAPVPCFLPQGANPDGTTMCHEGTRYCRNGTWGACEDVHSYSVVPRQDSRLLPDVVRRNTCSDCEQNCFVAQDYLEFVDAGLGMYANGEIEQIPAGGLTIRRSNDAGLVMADGGPDMFPDGAVTEWPLPDAGPCVPGTAPDQDCDNVPDYYDWNPTLSTVPFATPPIVATTPSNLSVNVDIDDFEFRITEADVYFMLDVTREQSAERQAFIDAINDVGINPAPYANLVEKVSALRGGPVPYPCVDADGDGSPDNFRKSEGFVGAMRCFVGDAYLGLGFMDEVPVRDSCSLSYGGITVGGTTYGATTWTQCHYGDDDSASAPNNPFARIPFRNLFDLSGNDVAFKSAVWRLPEIPSRLEIPQSGAQALWALANGSTGDLYYGATRPAFGARRDCPAGTYGAGCFRSGVLPISFMFTDTGQHNGPNNYIPVGYRPPITTTSNPTSAGAPYVANNLAFPSATWGTPFASGERARHASITAESLSTADPLGTLTNQRVTVTGTTIGMNADVPAAAFGCGADPGAPDAFIGFDLAAPANVTISATSTPYDSNGTPTAKPTNFVKSIGLFDNVAPPTAVPITMMDTPLGAVSGSLQLTGSMSNFGSAHGSSISRCGADGATGEAVVTFTTATSYTVSLDNVGPQSVIDIYSATPPVEPTPTAVSANDTFGTAYPIPGADPGYQTFTGDTSDGMFPNDHLASVVSCGATSDSANDAIYSFTVSGPRTVRIDTEGSTIDTVISLHDGPPLVLNSINVDNSNALGGADSTTGFNMGVADNSRTDLYGDSSVGPAAAQFVGASAGAAAACLGADSNPDHLLAFNITAPGTNITIQEQSGAMGGATDPAVALYLNTLPTLQGSISSFLPITGENSSSAYDFDTALVGGIDNRLIVVDGADITTGPPASAKANDFTAAQVGGVAPGCGTNPVVDAASDVVYHFRTGANAIPNATFTLTDQAGARPKMALIQGASPSGATAVTGNDSHPGYAVTLSTTNLQFFTGSTASLANQYSEYGLSGVACNTGANARDAIYRVTNTAVQGMTFKATSTTGHAPVLRLFPSTPWVNANLPPADSTGAAAVAVTGRIARGGGDFDSYGGDNSDTCATDNSSRDAFYRISLATRTTLRLHAHGDNDSEVTMAVFPDSAPSFVPANYALDYAGATVGCLAGGNDVNSTVTLNAGTYYVVVKARRAAGSCGWCGCWLCPAPNYQDDNFYLEVFDASTGANGTVAQAQLACDNSGTNSATLNYPNLPIGTYDLVVTSEGASTSGGYLLQMGPTTATPPSPVVCSTYTDPAWTIPAAGVGVYNSAATAKMNPQAVQGRKVRFSGDMSDYTDKTDFSNAAPNVSCTGTQTTRDAVVHFSLSEQRRLRFTATTSTPFLGTTDNLGVQVFATTMAGAGPDPLAITRASDVATGLPHTCSGFGGSTTTTMTLAPGYYFAVVKPGSTGTFNARQDDDFTLEIEDLNTVDSFTYNLAANTDYYLVVKNRETDGEGEYRLNVGAAVAPAACLSANTAMTFSGGTALPVGTHYALVKGGSTTTVTQTVAENGTANVMCPGGTTIVGYTSKYGDQGVGTCAVDCGMCTLGATSCSVTYNNTNCGDCSPGFVKPGTLTLNCIAGGALGTYTLRVGPGGAAADRRLACDDNSGTGNSSSLTHNLPAAGTYYVVVKGKSATDEGQYRLNIRDMTGDSFVGCANRTTQTAPFTLPAGTYTAIIKGSEGADGPFAATFDDGSNNALDCSNGTSFTQALGAGHHVVGIKGTAANHTGQGAYQVTIEAGSPPSTDGTIPASQRAFASKTWGNTRSAVLSRGMRVVPMQSCEPGTDWGTGTGDPNTGGTSGAFNACGDHYSGPLAFVLGIIAAAIGWVPIVGCILFDIVAIIFVLIGLVDVNSPTVAAQLNPVTCDAGGVLANGNLVAATSNPQADADALYAALQEPSGQNPPRGAWPQSKEIARTTETVTSTGTPIAYWLRRNPTSDRVAYDVADALYQLANEIRMDVSITMVWDSFEQTGVTPGYVVNATAVTPSPCVSAAGSTHRDCSPGDEPDFQVTFLNPTTNPVTESVPANFSPATDWRGAWPGRLVVLGDGQFVLREIPVLMIPPLPDPMPPPPQPPRYSGADAVYYQDIGTRECEGTNLPDWTDLYFNAEMPPLTEIEFRACAANLPTDLCTWTSAQTVALVRGTTTPCFNDSQCRGINGFCGNGGPEYIGGYCQVISPQKHKGLCGSEAECPDGPENGITPFDLLSDCMAGECEYDSQPADLGAALGAQNFQRLGRVWIALRPNAAFGTTLANAYAPNLLDWAVTYVCTPNQ